MEGFLDYLDEFKYKIPQSKPVVNKVEENNIIKPKVLCMNVEIRTVEGAQKVIEKLQEWISKQEPKEYIELKETIKEEQKPKYKIAPKKVIKNPLIESRNRAVDILDGISDDIKIISQEKSINNKEIQSKETVSGHASMLL